MRFIVISIFPEMFSALSEFGISARAVNNEKVQLTIINPREFATNRYQSIDDRPFGGGPGMVMMYDPLQKAIMDAKKRLNKLAKVVYLSPQGKPLTQARVKELACEDALILLCGRYEGIDERLIERHVDEEISIGDYVLSGGELPAMVLMDSIMRLLPDVLNDQESAVEDSFYNGLLDCPHYTRPAQHSEAGDVPAVLLSGDHRKIQQWRQQQKIKRTFMRRKDLIECLCLSDEDKQYLAQIAHEEQNKT
ncbi:tRNA (guanosine(37)-N1)-methyltransferase TrmD [Fastidiosibacter lacustris]|uniref:tRNA (guanosine(37)-N1)-methyltransferase TrmD n=1 Tax=Fastidiosibacter lacustris TaxID=2056695 RepID=UPI000E350849|nr:tRNA (guanosine(37)-N1)-methyltransferase TrmD [Fastidiosibacter lacustris]